MKNAEDLRGYLIEKDCYIETDDIFTDGKKYYFIIKGRKGGARKYSEKQLRYGKDSLTNPVLFDYLSEELKKNTDFSARQMSESSRIQLMRRIEMIQEVLKSETDGNIQ